MAFNRPCLKCGTLTRNRAGYCDRHTPTRYGDPELKAKKKFLYGGTYKARAKIVRENSTHCHICKEPFTGGDRVEADHMYPELGAETNE
jgi:hypothetical protein